MEQRKFVLNQNAKAKELIEEAIEKLVSKELKYFDFTMGMCDMAYELGAINKDERAALVEKASYAFWRLIQEKKLNKKD